MIYFAPILLLLSVQRLQKEELITPQLNLLQRAQAVLATATTLGDTDSDIPPRYTQKTHGRCSTWEEGSWGAGVGAAELLRLDKLLPHSPTSQRACLGELLRRCWGCLWGKLGTPSPALQA